MRSRNEKTTSQEESQLFSFERRRRLMASLAPSPRPKGVESYLFSLSLARSEPVVQTKKQ